MPKHQPEHQSACTWQDERDDELDAPDTYPEPEPESNYTPDQS